MVGEVKQGLRRVNGFMRGPFTFDEKKISNLNADMLDRMARDQGAMVLPVREAIVAAAFNMALQDKQDTQKKAAVF
jgi:hypothetical protein